jgi:hypothetical protein
VYFSPRERNDLGYIFLGLIGTKSDRESSDDEEEEEDGVLPLIKLIKGSDEVTNESTVSEDEVDEALKGERRVGHIRIAIVALLARYGKNDYDNVDRETLGKSFTLTAIKSLLCGLFKVETKNE